MTHGTALRPDPTAIAEAASVRRGLRVWVAVTLAVGLHSWLLLPVHPTLVGSATPDASPAMSVRLIARNLMSLAEPVPEGHLRKPFEPESGAPSTSSAAAPVASSGRGFSATPAVAVAAPAQASHATPAAIAPEPGLPPAPAYFTSGRLDPGPRPLEDVEPVYPEEAKQQVGTVVLRLLINEAGTVDNVAVVRASPAGPFEQSALEAFGKAKFSPGKMLGVAVKSQITIEVMFTPINRGKVSGRSY